MLMLNPIAHGAPVIFGGAALAHLPHQVTQMGILHVGQASFQDAFGVPFSEGERFQHGQEDGAFDGDAIVADGSGGPRQARGAFRLAGLASAQGSMKI